MLYSLGSPSCGLHVSFGFDRRSGGFFGTLPDSTAELLHLKCVLAGIIFKMMVSTLEPDYLGRYCHSWYQSRTKRTPESATRFQKFNLKLSHTIAFGKYVGS